MKKRRVAEWEQAVLFECRLGRSGLMGHADAEDNPNNSVASGCIHDVNESDSSDSAVSPSEDI